MAHKYPQKFLVGMVAAYITSAVLEYPYQTDVVKIPRKPWFDILEIAHMNGYVVTVAVPVSIDQAALFRQVHTGDAAGLPGKSSGDSPAAAAHFQHFVLGAHGHEIHDILPQGGQMVQYGPAFPLLNQLRILHLGIFPHNVQQFVLHRAVAVDS